MPEVLPLSYRVTRQAEKLLYRVPSLSLNDPARGVLEKIGEPDEYSGVCWLPNGKEFILERVEPDERMDVPLRHAVCIMNLRGEVRKLADGKNAIPLADGRILFQRPNYRWATIMVDGKSNQNRHIAARSVDDACLVAWKARKFISKRQVRLKTIV